MTRLKANGGCVKMKGGGVQATRSEAIVGLQKMREVADLLCMIEASQERHRLR